MPTLVRKLSQIGNSKGLILPHIVLEMLDWGPDTEIELKISGNRLILSPADRRYATDEEAMKAGDKVFKRRRGLMEKLAKS
jgi:antitoxin component of MazEF toxin-antitoxin module